MVSGFKYGLFHSHGVVAFKYITFSRILTLYDVGAASLCTRPVSFRKRYCPPRLPHSRVPARFLGAVNDSGAAFSDDNAQESTVNVPFSEDASVKEQILDLTMDYVPQYGWSQEAVEAACKANGYPPGLHTLAMPRGPIDLIQHFYASRNVQLARSMSEWRSADPQSQLSTPSEVDAFLYRALQHRLHMILPVLEKWPQALGILALPSNAPSSIGLLAQLIDEVWAQAGDRSTDMTWYAKRLGLAYVYNLTEVYMLQDKSPDLANSWTFLQSRIVDLRSLKEMNLKAVASMLRDGVCAFGNVTFNLLGWTRMRQR